MKVIGSRSSTIAKALCLALSMLLSGCSGNREHSAEKAQSTAGQGAPAAGPGEDFLPATVRTAWKGDLDEIAKRRVVRVLVPFRRPEFFYVEGRPAGILHEAFQEVERLLNDRYKTTAANRIVVVLLPTPINKLGERMTSGYGDIAAYGVSITEDTRKLVDFTVPTMTGLKMIVVTGPRAPELKDIRDLGGKEVWIMPKSRMEKDLESLNAKLKSQGKPPAVVRMADPVLDQADVMETVNAGTYPIALMQNKTAEFWADALPNLRPRMDLAIAEDVETGWAIQKGTPKLKAFLDEFLQKNGVGTAFGNTLVRRYMKEEKYVKNAADANELKKFRATAPIFRKYATNYELDYLLLVAQGYQESRLDHTVRSRVGAVGIMQVMPSTAAAEPVKVKNIQNQENNIHAGVRMVHFLINDYFNEKELDKLNRTLFAIAAYNAGPAKITRCRKAAQEMGYDPNKWFGNTEVAVARIVGIETTRYVANIYKYYIAYRMAEKMVHKG